GGGPQLANLGGNVGSSIGQGVSNAFGLNPATGGNVGGNIGRFAGNIASSAGEGGGGGGMLDPLNLFAQPPAGISTSTNKGKAQFGVDPQGFLYVKNPFSQF